MNSSRPPQDFDGLRAVVTGGASGIGAETVRELRARGGQVAVLDRDEDPADRAVYRADVRSDDEVARVIDAIASDLGGLDVVINNAGVGAQGGVAANSSAVGPQRVDTSVAGMSRVRSADLS